MNVLILDEEIPYPLNSGKRIRTYSLLKYLAASVNITYLCRLHENLEKPYTQALERIGIEPVVVSDPIRKKSGCKFYLSLLGNLFSKYPYVVSSHRSRKLVKAIRRITAEQRFDLIHCEWTPYAVNLQALLPYPSVVVAHNVESLVWRRQYEVEGNFLKKMYIYLQWKKMEQFERKAFSLFNRCIAVSERDRDNIAQWVPRDQIDVVANGVDVDFFKPLRTPGKQHSLVFTGALDWRPNVDSMLYFLDKIWPQILHSYPDASFTVVGRNPLGILKDRVANARSVALTGTVEDVRPYIEKATAYVVPLRVGSGSRLKILEAFSMCKPVVSTSIGAEGLEVVPDRDLLIADEPESFARAIMRLFEDVSLRQKLGSSGRIVVEKQYQWKHLAKQLKNVWSRVIGCQKVIGMPQRQRGKEISRSHSLQGEHKKSVNSQPAILTF